MAGKIGGKRSSAEVCVNQFIKLSTRGQENDWKNLDFLVRQMKKMGGCVIISNFRLLRG